MALLQTKQRVRGSIPTSSMADIAFLLLIFFLVTTIFDEEKGLPLVLPDFVDVPVSPKNLLFLLVRPDGLVEIKRGEAVATQMVPSSAVGAIWRMEAAENPNLIAAIRTHANARYEQMIDVLDQLKEGGATRIALQRLEP